MPHIEYEAYRRWLDKWTPHLVYGASAAGGVEHSAAPAPEPVALTDLPGGSIVRAF